MVLFSHEGNDRDRQSGSWGVQETSTAVAGLTGKLGVVCKSSWLQQTEHTRKLTHSDTQDYLQTGRILGLGKWRLLLTFSQTVHWGECWGPGVTGRDVPQTRHKEKQKMTKYCCFIWPKDPIAEALVLWPKFCCLKTGCGKL